jgi:hypothetical protein
MNKWVSFLGRKCTLFLITISGQLKSSDRELLLAAEEYYKHYDESRLPHFRYLPIVAYLLACCNW